MPVNFGPPECVVITDLSPVAAGGIASFHPSPIAVRLQGNDSSLWLSCVPDIFRHQGTRPYGVPLTRDPLHSAVWTFLPPSLPLRAERRARIRIPRYPISISQNPASRERLGCLDRNFFPKNLRCTDSIHTCSANWTFPFHCGFAIFHGDFHCFRIFALCAAFDTVHCCHIIFSPPFPARNASQARLAWRAGQRFTK